MSEPIQSISQGNYILATQQEVSHDNTLSGNGTSASPLGVVPGYNETVLFEGNCISGQTFTAAEPVSSFESYKIYLRNYERQQQTVIEKYVNTANTGNLNKWVTLDCFQAGENGGFFTINCGKGQWDDTYSVFSYNGGYAAWMGNDLTWHQITSTAALPTIQKVIGINRKSGV